MLTHLQATAAPPSRVVILSAGGFIGKNLTGHLSHLGWRVLPVSSSEVDLRREESIGRLRGMTQAGDALVITSAITPDRGKDVGTLMANLSMGEHVARLLPGASFTHVVYISSDAVYDDGANPVHERSCCSPSSFHGLMHLVRERMLAHALAGSGVPLLILRPSLLYGAGDTHGGYGPNRFLRTARDDRKITLFGEGEERRDHVYIEDLSRVIGLCLAHRSEGILNVATGASTSFHDVAEAVAALCDGPVEMVFLPRATPIAHRHFDIAATLRAFPSFRVTPLREGLAATVAHIGESAGA